MYLPHGDKHRDHQAMMTFKVCIYGLVTTGTTLHFVRNIVIRGAS